MTHFGILEKRNHRVFKLRQQADRRATRRIRKPHGRETTEKPRQRPAPRRTHLDAHQSSSSKNPVPSAAGNPTSPTPCTGTRSPGCADCSCVPFYQKSMILRHVPVINRTRGGAVCRFEIRGARLALAL